MGHPQAKRMTDAQRSMVEAALNAAFNTGRCFESTDAIDEYLKDLLSEHLRHSFLKDIFDCYLRLKATRERSLPSPPLCDGSQSNTFDPNLDAQDGSEKSDTIAVEFVSEDHPIPISFYRPRFNDLRTLHMRYCKGSVSYISENLVRQNLLPERRQRTILDWYSLGNGAESGKTRCEIVNQDQIPNCELALATDHGKQDTEEMEEEEGNEGPSTDPRPDRLGACVLFRGIDADEPLVPFHALQTFAPPSFSPDEEAALRMTSLMTYDVALSALKEKPRRPRQLSTPRHHSVSIQMLISTKGRGKVEVFRQTILSCSNSSYLPPGKVPSKSGIVIDISVPYIKFDILTNDWWDVHRAAYLHEKLVEIGNRYG